MRTRVCSLAVAMIVAAGAPIDAQAQTGSITESVVRYDPPFFASLQPATALDMVRRLPGFTISAGDASVRGFAGAAGNVLIDGRRPADKQFTVDQALERIPAGQVSHIELIRGGAPGVDMMGQSLVANVVRKPARASWAVSVSDSVQADGRHAPGLSVEGRRRSGEGAISGAASVTRYVDNTQSDGLRTRRDPTGGVMETAEIAGKAGGWTAFAYGGYEAPALGGRLSVNAGLVWTDFVKAEVDQTIWPDGRRAVLQERLGGPLGGQVKAEASGRYGRDLSPGLTSESFALVRVNRQTYESHLAAPGLDLRFDGRDRGGEALARSGIRYAPPGPLQLEASVEGAYNWLETQAALRIGGAAIPLPNGRASISERRGEAAAGAVWRPGAPLRVEAGARLELSTIEADADARQRQSLAYLKPRAAVAVSGSAGEVRVRIEREVGQLDFANFAAASALDSGTVRAGAGALRPQQAWVVEAAYERRFWTDGAVVLTWRHGWLSDVIDRVPVRDPAGGAAFDAPGNIGDGTQDVLTWDLTLPLDRFGLARGRFKASGALRRSSVVDPTTGERRAISDEKPAEFVAELRQDLPDQRLTWMLTVASACGHNATGKACGRTAYRFNEVDIYEADIHANLAVEFRPRPRLTVRLAADGLPRYGRRRVTAVYDGPRDRRPLAYVDDRRLALGPAVSVRIRWASE